MVDVQFNEEPEYVKRAVPASKRPSLMARLVKAAGLANDEKGVQRVLLIVLVLVLVATGFVLASVVDTRPEPQPLIPVEPGARTL